MKNIILPLVFLAQSTTFAYSVANEKCWSAAPIGKPLTESKKLDDEQKLCAIDFYSEAYTLCPKLNSTFPGVLVIKLPNGVSDEAFKSSCANLDEAKKKIDFKVEAKFKQTTSCSHASSGVTYYRVAEFLGGLKVPVAVFRTMDKQKHLDVVKEALQILKKPTDIIYKNWDHFEDMHEAPQKYPQVFIENNTAVFGALLENIKGEYIYTDVSGVGSYDTRYERFVQQKPYLNITIAKPVAEIAGTEFKTLAPLVTQMKDVSNMVIIDHMLNQADRIGNIHFKYKWYKNENGKVTKTDSEAKYIKRVDVIPEDEKHLAAEGSVLVKEMILKDNDCGISKDNNMKRVGALKNIKHLSPKMFQQVQKLAQYISTPEGADYFKKELRIPSENVMSIKGNILEVAKTLKANCENGSLNLDLDLEELLSNPNFKASCAAE